MARKKKIATEKMGTMLQVVAKKKKPGENSYTSPTRANFLRHFELSYGNVTYSCEAAGIDRKTYYRWMRSETKVNVKFRDQLNRIKPVERQLDFVEGALMQRVKAGDTTAIIFALKTLGRHRGYAEKVEITYNLTVKAVERLEKVIKLQLSKDPEWQPNLKRLAEIAGEDFGVSPEEIEREYLKRQPKIVDGGIGVN